MAGSKELSVRSGQTQACVAPSTTVQPAFAKSAFANAAAGLVAPTGLLALNFHLLDRVVCELSPRQAVRLAASCAGLRLCMQQGEYFSPPRVLPSEFNIGFGDLNTQCGMDALKGQIREAAQQGPVKLCFGHEAVFDGFARDANPDVDGLDLTLHDAAGLESRIVRALTQFPELSSLALHLNAQSPMAVGTQRTSTAYVRHCRLVPGLSKKLHTLDIGDFHFELPGEFLAQLPLAFPKLGSLDMSVWNPVASDTTRAQFSMQQLRAFAEKALRLRELRLDFSVTGVAPLDVLHALKPALPRLESLAFRSPDWPDDHPDWVDDALVLLGEHAPKLTSLCFRNFQSKRQPHWLADATLERFLTNRPPLRLLNLGMGVHFSEVAERGVLAQMQAGIMPGAGRARIVDEYGVKVFRINV